jgi:transposase-like protein
MISKRGELAVQTRRIAIGILLLWGGVKPRSPRGVMEAIANPVSHSRTKRIYRSVEERRRIVEETLVPGVSVATVARAHGVNDNQVFGWRKLYQTGLLEPKILPSSQAQQSPVRLLPVMISAEKRSKRHRSWEPTLLILPLRVPA